MSYYQSNQAPSVPPPWVAEWDDQSQRYYFVNQQTGERAWDQPSGYGGGEAPYGYGAAGLAGYEAQRAGESPFPPFVPTPALFPDVTNLQCHWNGMR